MSSLFAKLSLVFVAFVWGSGFVVAQMALDAGVSPFYMMSFRFSIAFVIMMAIAIPYIHVQYRSHIMPGIILGIFLFLGFAFQTIGLQYTTPSKNAFLTTTNIVMAPFIFWMLLKQRPSFRIFVGAVICLIGIAFISLSFHDFSMNKGDVLTLICAVFFAFHIVGMGYYTMEHNLNPTMLVFFQMGVAALLSIISALLFETFDFALTYKSIGSVLYLGVFSTMLAFFLQNNAQKYILSTTAAIILSLESVFGALLSVLILKEVLSLTMIIGAILVLFAIVIIETNVFSVKKSTVQ